MVRPLALIGPARRVALVVMMIAIVSIAARGQTPGSDPASLLNVVLDRASTTAAGTYAVTATTVAPDASALPVVVQADTVRGEQQSIRVAIALGAVTPQPYVARVRVLRVAAPGAAPQVAGDANGTGQGGKLRFIREFALAAGEYDVYSAVGYARSGGAVVTLNKLRLTVPDIWKGSLAVTPIVLGEAAGATPRVPGTRPFEFEPTALTLAASDRFPQAGQVHFAFRIYNWSADANSRPDVSTEYVFYQRSRNGQRFFNKTKPQLLTAGTMGPAFDPGDGVVTAGMSLPLSSFPMGEFDLVVRVTDNRSKQKAERRVAFTVDP